MKRYLHMALVYLLLAASASGCGEELAWIEDDSIDLNDDYGKPTLAETVAVGKGDSLEGGKLLPVSVDTSSTQVWEVRNQWGDTDTVEARKAGLSWEANSGLTWDEKYQAWVKSLAPVTATEGYSSYTTFTLVTPFGKTLPAPRLECAETALFLRATFASWYGLPFIVAAWDSGPVYFGHFGIRTKEGKYGSTPNFKTAYSDYSDMSVAQTSVKWPTDKKLRQRKLSQNADDKNGFLCEDCYAGAYFDEIFLNKRVGHFLAWLLTYTGSMHLASSDNAFHLEPKAVKEGDVLLERWRKKGIGHTLIVKKVDALEGGLLGAELASGSMPRRQPVWETAASSKSYFTNPYCGGPGENGDGEEYARLGGGLKRFRQPRVKDGYWHLVVPPEYVDFWVMDSETERLAGRIAAFEALLGSLSPQAMAEVYLEKIEAKRTHLRNYPASCAARIEREKAFEELYQLQLQHFGFDQETVDKQYRILDDYVFAKLDYNSSKTCCWNSSTAAMYEIVMAYNQALLASGSQCPELAVFKATDGGYELFANYAESIGRGDEWVAWSADEECPQADVADDTEAAHQWTPYCDIAQSIADGGSGPCDDAFGTNNSSDLAADLAPGSYPELKVCSSLGSDWYRIAGDGQSYVFTVTFDAESSDIDVYLFDSGMNQVDSSATTSGSETVKMPGGAGDCILEVRLYSGTMATYDLGVAE